MTEQNKVTISAIVPVHKGGEDFKQCMASLRQATPAPDEIIVVADGDTADDAQVAETYGAQVMRVAVAQGPAQARNLGASKAHGDILFFVDADVAIATDALAQLVTIFAGDPAVAAIFGSYDDAPAAPNFLSQYKNLMHHYVHQTGRAEASTFWSGCGAVRRKVFQSLGGFSSDYRRPCIEDIELGYRMKQAGHRIQLCKQLQGKHLKRWDAVSLVRTDFFQRALPWSDLILRDRQMINDLNLGGASRASVMLVYALLATLLGALLWPSFFGITAILIFLLMMLNAPIYAFFQQKRGLGFSMLVVPWHWFYYFYSGLALMIGIVRHLSRRLNVTQPQASTS
jgi:glycosyltransferase involved in cell wall biosynthesis